MSSTNVPARRTTRLTRAHLDENATSATTRMTRGSAKPVAIVSVPVKPVASTAVTRRPTLTTNKEKETASSTRAIDAAKRKRDALGELTNKTKAKGIPKDKDGKPLGVKAKELLHKRSESMPSTAAESMDVDGTKAASEEADARPRFSRRVAARTVSTSSVPAQPSAATVAQVAGRRIVSAAATRILRAPSQTRGLSTQVSASSIPTSVPATQDSIVSQRTTPEDEQDGPAHKRRRTSSLDAEEASRAVAHVNEKSALEAIDVDEPWTDLDKDDEGDPLMVSEYVVDIFNYMLEIERKHAQVLNPNYIEKQKELNWGMRGILGDWLIQVHARFRLLPETLYLAMHLVDRMLSIRVVSLSRLQLVGVTCMFIASKYEEIMAPSVKHFVECADAAYTEKDILDAEQYVLRVLGWDCSYPNVMTFLRRVSKAEDFDDQTRSVAKFFVEIACVDHRLLPFPQSQIAAASLWLARLILDRDPWNGNLVHYSTYREKDLLEPANIMINYLLEPIKHEAFWKKYASKRYMKVSPYVRDWALMKWQEGQEVDLAAELPELRAGILERREKEVF
ncbi:G2/mitotic-specific cyclin cdc13 [Ceratobasidium theobromae]|uniref:G2/mitotic-specific cyclin cdc13 n=1 Tax=Ceratobasidium theobromae TaxID=1582974 RepID=A0A5N5QD91_9AGAM|nr:G2/mitotic-specific cyclin cdc13 [Ceratobasidium theobromae]